LSGRVCGCENRRVLTENGVDGNLMLIIGCRNLEREGERETQRERQRERQAERDRERERI